MDRALLESALRVLSGTYSVRRALPEDINLVREHTLPEEKELDLDDMACAVVQRLLTAN